MSKIWFSSDFHLGHRNIVKGVSDWESGYRDFQKIEEMDHTILDSINKRVQPEDTLYFLGDFSFGGHTKIPEYRSRIACQIIHVCRGNHDEKIDLYKEHFTSIQDVLTVKHGKHTFFLSHYSHRTWLGSHKGILHLYGHSHGTISDFGKSMDVGIDVAKRLKGEYRPFSIEEIIQIMDKKEIEYPDHHDKNTNIR